MTKTITTTFSKLISINRIHLLIIMCLFSLFVNAQSKIIIKGKLIEKETSVPIEEATVYITSVKDSAVIDYTISDKNGFFKIETKKISTSFFLKIDVADYQFHPVRKNSCTENKDFGVLSLLKKEVVLAEVVVKSEAPPIKNANFSNGFGKYDSETLRNVYAFL